MLRTKHLILQILSLVFLLCYANSFECFGQNLQDYLNEGKDKYNKSDFRGALQAWEKGLELARTEDNNQAIGAFLGNIGVVYQDLGDYPKALSYYEQALKIKREIGDKKGEGADLTNIGNIYNNLGDYPKALSYYEQALKIKREIGDRNGEGNALINIGVVYQDLGDYPKALSYYEQALKIKREIGDKKGEGNALTNIGVVYSDLGDYPKALSYYEQALKIDREIGDKKGEGNALGNIGNVYNNLGDYPKALSYYEQVLKIHKEIGDKKGEGADLCNIGIVYKDLGNYPKALSYYEQALKIDREIGDKKGEGADLTNIGNVYWNLGDYPKALSYYEQALKIKREIGVPTRIEEANIGDVYLEQGRLKDAFEVFERLKYPIRLGRYYLKVSDYPKAKKKFEKSLKIVEEQRTAALLLANYIGLGLSYEGLKDYPKAKEFYQKGIEFIERQRAILGGMEREKFFEAKVMGFSRLEPYEGMVRVLMKEKGAGYESKSLQFAERAKSRTFVESLATRALKGKTKEDATILEKEKELQQNLLVLRKRLEVMANLVQSGKAPLEEFNKLEAELNKAEADYERFIKEVKLKNSELASLISVEPLSVEKIQSLLEPELMLLEYFITEDRTYAWLLSKTEIKAYEIEWGRKKLEAKVNDFLLPNISNLRTHRQLPRDIIVVAADETYAKPTDDKERKQNREKFYEVAKEFNDLLLAPIEKDIKTQRLVIVPHGVLHKIPFCTFSDGEKFLAEKYTISVLPAASVIEFVVKKRKAGQNSLLAFANPVVEADPLPESETEVKEISKLFTKNEPYIKEEATESKARRKAGDFDVIHLACHGLFNELQPLQSGLVLTRDAENDGLLQVHEIFGLDLKRANLVTLSACNTALSKIQGGDDLVGLSRGFIYAGTPSLLATLWSVQDESTSLLMQEFYKNLKKGLNKPEALRQAQLNLKKTPQYQHPYYWAGFEIIGDWQ